MTGFATQEAKRSSWGLRTGLGLAANCGGDGIVTTAFWRRKAKGLQPHTTAAGL
ncbi:hypothetical protein [Corynebacterium mustelae]|uniref:hypothetical protein n=1 Tax=Corynebacterium mustelae TaxID=571915 RepID=UPI001F21B4CA|nr:hypothetical protein [Corynebacterium mustelae]